MSDNDRNKFGVSFAFEYTQIIEAKLVIFIGFISFLSCSIFKNIAMSVPKSSVHGSSAIATINYYSAGRSGLTTWKYQFLYDH